MTLKRLACRIPGFSARTAWVELLCHYFAFLIQKTHICIVMRSGIHACHVLLHTAVFEATAKKLASSAKDLNFAKLYSAAAVIR